MAAMLHPLYRSPELWSDTFLNTKQSEYVGLMFTEDDQLEIDKEFTNYMNGIGASFTRAVSLRKEVTGHGGSQAAEYVRKNLFDNLTKHPKLITDTKVAIVESYQQTDSEFLQEEINQKHDAGSTASTAILVGDRLLVANVGDSRAVVCRGSTAYALSEDHKPNRKDERQRIEKAGGVVIWAGTWRVGGILAVSRAFGDRFLKQFVVAEPELQEETIDDGVKFLILASDGLWDVVSNQDAVTLVEAIPDAEEAAKSLVNEAICKGSADNVTCIIICFHNGTMEDQNEMAP
ncbi:hypothetical protein L7F22_060603 [Adiantum nelumboides]|nr:hypothetical protein [Adiantum nelumboides]